MVSRMAQLLMSSSLLAGLVPAHAGSWNATGSAQLSGNYDDNVRLTNAKTIVAASGSSYLAGQLQYQDDNILWSVAPRVVAVRYDGESTYDRTESYLTLLAKRATETTSSSISLVGIEDTTLTSELGSTGFSDVNKKRRNAAITLGSQWNATARVATSMQLYAAANRYIDAEQTGLVDYNYGTAQLSTTYQLSEYSSLSLQGSAGKLQVPDVELFDKTNQSVTLGYTLQWSPRWNSSFSVGPSRIQSKTDAQSGVVYSVSLARSAELSSYSASLQRNVTANGFGSLSQRDQFQLRWNEKITDRCSASLDATLIRTKNAAQSSALIDQLVEYGSVTGSLSWMLSPTWQTALSIGHTVQRVDNSQSRANRDSVALSITWNGLSRAL